MSPLEREREKLYNCFTYISIAYINPFLISDFSTESSPEAQVVTAANYDVSTKPT
jgi:hypothetical protein